MWHDFLINLVAVDFFLHAQVSITLEDARGRERLIANFAIFCSFEISKRDAFRVSDLAHFTNYKRNWSSRKSWRCKHSSKFNWKSLMVSLLAFLFHPLFLFAILAASASYIAVPAAMRIAAPKANPSLYVPMALAITFPFNITLGMPLYLFMIQSFN